MQYNLTHFIKKATGEIHDVMILVKQQNSVVALTTMQGLCVLVLHHVVTTD